MYDHYDHIREVRQCARDDIDKLFKKLYPLVKGAKDKLDKMLQRIEEFGCNEFILNSEGVIMPQKDVIDILTLPLVDMVN